MFFSRRIHLEWYPLRFILLHKFYLNTKLQQPTEVA